jgi:hypothetical protein
MNEVAAATDYASKQTDRWLFIAAIIVLLLVGLLIWRWIVADREKIATRLTVITDKHIESQQKLSEVVANNTAALNRIDRVMTDTNEVLHFCRNKNQLQRQP